MQSSPITSTPPTAFNIAGPNKKTIAEGIWNAGTVNAIDAQQFEINNGTLEIIEGPTIAVSGMTGAAQTPIVLNANPASAANIGSVIASLPNFTALEVIGNNASNMTFNLDAYQNGGTGGAALFRGRNSQGTPGTLTASISGSTLIGLQGAGYDGTAYSSQQGILVKTIENFTTSATGTAITFTIIEQGTTVTETALTVTGATGAKAVQVVGGLSIDQAGTFIANSTTAVTVAATGVTASSVIQTSVRTPGGTVTYPPHVSSIDAGVNFTIVAASLDTSTYNYAIIN